MKYSQLFQGKIVSFTDEDLLISYKIVPILNINNCSIFMKPYDLQTKEDQYRHINQINIKEIEKEIIKYIYIIKVKMKFKNLFYFYFKLLKQKKTNTSKKLLVN